ncbi:3-oxo-tetronate kinase [Nonomuraea insulae]|uniref:3-oxo-tetronate kinase n=1 Tax=Nonomuraea insulae TaxID=1616787 RepID=A0ABW1CD67_9ACTN
MPYLGAVADDFTGATDLATMLVARGFRTVVAVGPHGLEDMPEEEADAVVVALKSRTAPVADAVRDSLAALEALRAAGCERFYFKYCSTFDSTAEGNIGPVADALLDALGETRTVVVPSFPAAGRTVYRTRLFVHDDLLDESPMRDHPLTPMRDSHLGRLLAPQTRRRVHSIGHDTVRAGAAEIRTALGAPAAENALTVVDATTDADLRAIAEATAGLRLVTGAAGLALGLTGPHPGSARALPHPADRRFGVVLSGSASAATRAQVAHARLTLPHRRLDTAALRHDFHATVAGLIGFATANWRENPDRPPLIYSVGPGDDLGQEPELVERALAHCAAALVAAGAHHLLVAGGETSGAVVTALGARTLRIGAEISSGVTWSRTRARVNERSLPINLALKSGNFGETDIFTTAWDRLS